MNVSMTNKIVNGTGFAKDLCPSKHGRPELVSEIYDSRHSWAHVACGQFSFTPESRVYVEGKWKYRFLVTRYSRHCKWFIPLPLRILWKCDSANAQAVLHEWPAWTGFCQQCLVCPELVETFFDVWHELNSRLEWRGTRFLRTLNHTLRCMRSSVPHFYREYQNSFSFSLEVFSPKKKCAVPHQAWRYSSGSPLSSASRQCQVHRLRRV